MANDTAPGLSKLLSELRQVQLYSLEKLHVLGDGMSGFGWSQSLRLNILRNIPPPEIKIEGNTMAYELPKDAFIIEAIPFWQILFSNGTKQLYIKSSDDDPPPMELSIEKMKELLHVMENWTPELQKQILRELEAWDEELKSRGHSGLGIGWWFEQKIAEAGNRDFFKEAKFTLTVPDRE